MTLWAISPVESNQSVTEIQTWKKFDWYLNREEVFDWAEFTVNADNEPVIDLVNENGYRVNHDPEYSWSLSQLNQTRPEPTIKWIFPGAMTTQETESLNNAIEQSGYLALEADGWELENTDFWFYGRLNLTMVSDTTEE